MPSSVAEAVCKDLNPSIGRVRRLMNLRSCSIILLRYLDLTVVILVEQPNRLRILLTSLMPAPLAPLPSITIRNGMPLFDDAFAKNNVAAAVFHFSDSMKSRVLPSRSTARYKYIHWPRTLM
jgi:hypothetical protein